MKLEYNRGLRALLDIFNFKLNSTKISNPATDHWEFVQESYTQLVVLCFCCSSDPIISTLINFLRHFNSNKWVPLSFFLPLRLLCSPVDSFSQINISKQRERFKATEIRKLCIYFQVFDTCPADRQYHHHLELLKSSPFQQEKTLFFALNKLQMDNYSTLLDAEDTGLNIFRQKKKKEKWAGLLEHRLGRSVSPIEKVGISFLWLSAFLYPDPKCQEHKIFYLQ